HPLLVSSHIMNRKIIRSVVVLAVISFVGIVALQVFWFRKAYSYEQKQFEDKAFIALNTVAEQIYSLKKDNAEIVTPVKQISPNYFVVQINDTLHPYLLENLLIQEFKSRNLRETFEYAIYDCFTDSIVFGKSVNITENESESAHYLQYIKWERDGHYFGVYFPQRGMQTFSNLEVWIYSTILIIIITVFFAYTIFVILQQKKLSEVRSDFVNNMTHELKTPIATINLTASALAEKKLQEDPERLRQYISILSDEGERLKTLVEKVLQASNADSGSLRLSKVQLNMNEVVIDVMTSFADQLSAGEISLELAPDLKAIVADKFHLTNVVFNLVENAIKYSKDRLEITIVTRNAGKFVELVVSDKGQGIPREHQKKIFEKFYRVPTGDIYQTKGYGLGLFYVSQIAEKHNGTVSLHSEPGQGTTFIVRLPVTS
ncbi:MAG: HAMP domain-containing sensor histidine kinase, partial [Bacteroidota bacterium]